MSQDSRRVERRNLLLDTALELLATQGWGGTSVRAVCQAAQLNPRYFYESFESLDDLLVAVYDRVVDELTEAVTGAVFAGDPDLRAQMRTAIETILDFIEEDPRRGRILYQVALGNETLNRRRLETGRRLVELIEQDATSRVDVAPGEQVGRMGAAILVGGFGELLAEWLAGRIEVSREQLAEDTTTLLLGLAESASEIVRTRRGAPRD
jgi:AcrR family transcriptional regulator